MPVEKADPLKVNSELLFFKVNEFNISSTEDQAVVWGLSFHVTFLDTFNVPVQSQEGYLAVGLHKLPFCIYV